MVLLLLDVSVKLRYVCYRRRPILRIQVYNRSLPMKKALCNIFVAVIIHSLLVFALRVVNARETDDWLFVLSLKFTSAFLSRCRTFARRSQVFQENHVDSRFRKYLASNCSRIHGRTTRSITRTRQVRTLFPDEDKTRFIMFLVRSPFN